MSKPTRPSFTPRNWPVWLGVAVCHLAASLPWGLQRWLGALLGALLGMLLRGRRRVARINIDLCFPQWTPAQRQSLLRASFRDLGVGVFEFLRAWFGDVAPLRRDVRIEGLEILQRLQAEGRGVLLVSGHFMTLEVCGRLLCDHVPLAGMYRAHATDVFEWAVRRGRLRYAAAMFKREDVRAAIKHLKRGGFLWYAPDQDMRGKDVAFAPFFGVPAASITATHQFARMSGAAVVPFFHRREGARYLLRIAEPLSDFPSSDAAADTARVNAAIEAMVREAPTQYLWIHKRFKRRPVGETRIY